MAKALTYLAACILLCACGNATHKSNSSADTIAMSPCPTFMADSAMALIEAQCAFGARVPGTEAHSNCGDWIAATMKGIGLEVREQCVDVTNWEGKTFPCRNIIARYNPSKADRIVLCAHWDSRPWADADPKDANHRQAVMGANDGASGTAMLIQIARTIKDCAVDMRTGIDFIFFDCEDGGTPRWAETDDAEDTSLTWCLGSQAWAAQAFADNYQARFGILFDMVGGRGARFAMEGVSLEYAEPVVQMLWHVAHQLGYGQYFPLKRGAFITDDHVALNQTARIPTLDIVPFIEDGPSVFGPTWHTVSDTPDNIDPNVLEAVGQSVIQLLYNDN